MGKSLKLFASLFLGLAFLFQAVAEDDVRIIIVGDESGSEIIHRSPVPITCVLDGSLLFVDFLDNLGSVTIEIENQTTGEYSQSVVNALAGPMLLPISGTSGYWTILFTLPSGVQYFGEFDIL